MFLKRKPNQTPDFTDAMAEHRAKKSHQAAAVMVQDGLDALPFHKALNVVLVHLEDRKGNPALDIDQAALERFANMCGRLAHEWGKD